MNRALLLLIFISSAAAHASSNSEVVCSYAPSQSKLVAGLSGLAGGASFTAAATAKAAGLVAVTHSSGATILTGSGGYVAGTIGGAATGPFIITVGLLASGAAVSIELLCAPANHPEQVAQVTDAANEFAKRSGQYWQQTKVTVGSATATVIPVINSAAVTVKNIAGDVFAYANRTSTETLNTLYKW